MRTRQTLIVLAALAWSTHGLADDSPPKIQSVVVRHDSVGKRVGGIVLTSVGGLFFTGGAALGIGAGVGIAGGRGDLTSALDLMLAGAAMLVGLGTGIPGIVLIATSGEKTAIRPVDEAKLTPTRAPGMVTLPILTAAF